MVSRSMIDKLIMTAKYDRALELLESKELELSSYEKILQTIKIHIHRGEYMQAMHIVEELIVSEPLSAFYQMLFNLVIGLIYTYTGDIANAQSTLNSEQDNIIHCHHCNQDQQNRLRELYYRIRGRVCIEEGKFNEAIDVLTHSFLLAEKMGNKYLQALSLRDKGVALTYLGNLDQASNYYDQCQQLINEINCTYLSAKLQNSLGVLYWYKKMYGQSLTYYNKSLAKWLRIGNEKEMNIAILNIGAMV